VGLAPDAGLLDAERSWVRGLWEALRPHAMGSGDGYINGITDFSDDRVRHSYGPAKYERLAQIKAQYDPATCPTSTPTSAPPDAASASVRVRKPTRPRRTREVSSKHEIRLCSAWVGRLEFA
jgi:Berberine and berberine like